MTDVKLPLSQKQLDVLRLLGSGWTCCHTGGRDSGAFLQQGKIGYGGASKPLHSSTLWALQQRRLVQRYGGGIGSSHYKISRRGANVLHDLQFPKRKKI